MSEEELSVLRAQLDDLLKKGWIRPSSSPYDTHVLFVRKKNKELQLCIDYRKLNTQTVKNVGALSCIDDLLEWLGDAKFFAKLDLESGYHQLDIRQEDPYKTAFKTVYGHLEWLVMLFGLTNVPTTFQAAMMTEFRHMLDKFVLIYLDEILVYSQSLDEHVEHLRTVLERLRQAKYKANHDEYEFAGEELKYLGHYVPPQGHSRTRLRPSAYGPSPPTPRTFAHSWGWLATTNVSSPGDKKDEALDTWLRTVPVWVRAKMTLVEEEVITAASYLEGSAARWLNRLVASKGFDRNMHDWAQTHTLESFMDLVEARWHNPQQAHIATDGLLKLDTRKYKSVRELTTTVERLIVVPGVEYNPQVLLNMFLRCLPTDIRNLLASEAHREYHTFESFSKKALDLEARLGEAQTPSTDGRKKKTPQEWKKKGSRLMVVDSDGNQTEIDDVFDLVEGSEFDGEESAEGGNLAAVVKTKAAGRGKGGQQRSQGQATNPNKIAAWVRAGLDQDVWRDRWSHVCTFSYPGGEINHKISFLVSDELPFDMLLGMYYLEVAKLQFDWDKVLKHELPSGRTVRLAKYKASRLVDSYGCLCASAFYNYYKQNPEEGMYLVSVSAKGEAVKTPPEIEIIVAKYPDLLEEPTGVVDMEIVHAIEIIPGCKTPKGRIYRMYPAELDELRRQSAHREGTDECEATFKRLKHALTHHEVLMVPDPQRPFVVTTDASQYGIGAVLAQQEGKKLRPIEYMSKKMPSKKLAKSTYERELCALYKALVHWRHYLLGRFFYLRTDHQTLKWIKTQPVLSYALKRWIEVIDQYDFKLDYLKGEYNKVADALSRRADYLGALISEFGLSKDVTRSLGEAYKEDPITMDIINKLQAKDKPTSDEFVMVDRLLFLEKAGFKRFVVPSRETLRSLFLVECHDAMGHFGYKKTSANLVQRFWWPNMLDDVKKYVETCHVCQRDKPRTQAPLGLLKPLPIPAGPGQSISMDFMDTLVTSKNGKRHMFVIVDRFTKYARLIVMPETARTEHVIKLFMDNWVEQMNRVVQHLLRHYIKPSQDDWDEKLPLIASLYNNVVHSTIGVSPNQLHLGWKPRSALDFLLPENRTAATPGTIEFGVKYEKLLQQTVEHIKKSQEVMIAFEKSVADSPHFRVMNNPNITVHFNVVTEDVVPSPRGDMGGVVLRDQLTNETKILEVKGLFYGIGHTPNSRLFEGQIKLDDNGYVVAGAGGQTNVEGVFAAGDLQDDEWRQAITAAASGCMAALSVERYLTRTNLLVEFHQKEEQVVKKELSPQDVEMGFDITATKHKGQYALRKLYHESDRLIAVLYTSPTCGPCRTLKPILNKVILAWAGNAAALLRCNFVFDMKLPAGSRTRALSAMSATVPCQQCHVISSAMSAVPHQQQCHVSNSATSATVPRQQCHVSSATSAVPRQQQCHVSSATSATVPRQQCPATMTGSALGMPGQLANETIAEYKQRFQTQLALIEAEEQRQVAAEAVHLQAEAAATAEKQRLQAEADADTQARHKEAQDLLQRHEATSIEKLKFWHFEPSEEHDDATPEEQHKEFMAKLVTRLVYTCNHLQSELANLQRAMRNHNAQHEDGARALDSRVQDLEQTAPKPEAGKSSSAPSARQLEERVDHVVAMLGDISTFAAPATISKQLDTLKTEVQQLHQLPNKDGNTPQHYKMPTFQMEKFDDYMHQDPVIWWEGFTTQLRILIVPKHLYIGALFLNSKADARSG
ncbi:hypothetical protein CBR_g49843 [Chara braunii]|uniref:Reverse transcriptase domain-containing protein n=1 Tax=Chara braunii TaxID=69332 RepID=A0A388JP86_CHABU|nr:hypothetical protein CBR_g49843 [Chara braunii]|eukprot:GBG59583.1 hypothetical protein CBR_g49843 [Chara braunii]